MVWTSERPKECGWYWAKLISEDEPTIMWCNPLDKGNEMSAGEGSWAFNEFSHFAGPISEPEEA